ncbi:MAG: hypothetical protein NZ553_13375 [Caldilinea sp.]|nr:hypothetical protein [Caldilinea sp.]MDW8441462.1 hypothetical protein [Caldilineaceae bacterium]
MAEPVLRVRLHKRYPNLLFWLSFLVLNVLLFLPMAMVSEENALAPPALPVEGGWQSALGHLLIWRESLDPWRISVELTAMTALWVWLGKWRRKWLGALFGLIYMLMLTYSLYEAIVTGIYLLEPSFYSQFFLARDGLPFLAERVNAGRGLYVGALLVSIAGCAVVLGLWRVLLMSGASPGLSRSSRLILAGIAPLTLLASVLYQQYTARPQMVVSSFGYKLQRNFEVSLEIYRDVKGFDDNLVRHVYDYSSHRLAQKPDIYIIFVESYGSVLYKRPHFTPAYRALLSELIEMFKIEGWHVTTALSEAPTWGGGSWLSYTTTLFGMRIDNHPQYLDLRNKYQVERYPSLGATLHDQGYHYVWLSALDENISEAGWSKYRRMLAVDELIRFKDMGYVGPRYGWGPAPPDQWVLHWAYEHLKSKTDKPLMFFTITQNSHYPWAPHPTLAEDWRTLNQLGPEPEPVDPETIGLDAMRANYLNAIDYQLRMLTQWILDVGDENSIFVLIGDHQPPAVSRRADGWATPVHIISKDAAFIEAFAEYGFIPGLEVNELEPTLRHEGFYSMFMRALLGRYGVSRIAQPAYLPEGVMHEAVETANY